MKATILKATDDYLFNPTVNNLRTLYQKAMKINGNPFNYGIFGRALLTEQQRFHQRTLTVPTEETIEFLKPQLEKYTVVIERRELIQCYLLQFMNQSESTRQVAWLLTDKLLERIQNNYLPNLVRSIKPEELTLTFMAKPEYEMLRAQEVFMQMGL